jgi:hypothetical protein
MIKLGGGDFYHFGEKLKKSTGRKMYKKGDFRGKFMLKGNPRGSGALL